MTRPPRNTQGSAIRVLLTAAEAYPELEAAFLDARREIWASFRIFDPATRLRSRRARAVGETWFDLIVATLARGVALTLVLSDFDPTARPELHRGTWRSTRMLLAAAELAGPQARIKVIPAMHPARTGLLPRLLFWPAILNKQIRAARWLNRLPPDLRVAALRDMPGQSERLRIDARGRASPRVSGGPPRLVPATHHQKLAVFDRELLHIGGLDLDDRRFDTPEHDQPSAETWHDVQLMVRGPAVAEAQAHLEGFLALTEGRGTPKPARRILRTLSKPQRPGMGAFGPQPVLSEIAEAHAALARRAERMIYLETQYFRDRRLAGELARAARSNPNLCLILMLPGAPEEVAFEGRRGIDQRMGEYLQARCIRRISRAFGPRLFVGAAAQTRNDGSGGRATLLGAPLVYIHAKVSVFDDRGAIVSSANLNGRSLHWDTEAGLYLSRPTEVRELRHRAMCHWLPADAGPEFLDPVRAVGAWRALALANARTDPEKRRGFLLPYDLSAAEAFGRAAPGVPDEMV